MKLIKEVTNWQELNAWESFSIENGEDLLNIENSDDDVMDIEMIINQ